MSVRTSSKHFFGLLSCVSMAGAAATFSQGALAACPDPDPGEPLYKNTKASTVCTDADITLFESEANVDGATFQSVEQASRRRTLRAPHAYSRRSTTPTGGRSCTSMTLAERSPTGARASRRRPVEAQRVVKPSRRAISAPPRDVLSTRRSAKTRPPRTRVCRRSSQTRPRAVNMTPPQPVPTSIRPTRRARTWSLRFGSSAAEHRRVLPTRERTAVTARMTSRTTVRTAARARKRRSRALAMRPRRASPPRPRRAAARKAPKDLGQVARSRACSWSAPR